MSLTFSNNFIQILTYKINKIFEIIYLVYVLYVEIQILQPHQDFVNILYFSA